MSSAIREPAVAGQFYPRFPDALAREVHHFTRPSGKNMQALACVVPHAGYMYSGHVAGAVYASVQLPRRFVVLCPNHTGYGQPLAISAAGKWRTPLGEAAVDAELARELLAACPALQEDDLAHLREHAIEVQLPFLQVLVPEFTFVPIAVGTARYEPLHALGEALAIVVRQQQDKVLLIASSDMNHYEADDITRVKDGKAI
jgi:MEMO1 family protein